MIIKTAAEVTRYVGSCLTLPMSPVVIHSYTTPKVTHFVGVSWRGGFHSGRVKICLKFAVKAEYTT